jgi:hypothetical protein
LIGFLFYGYQIFSYNTTTHQIGWINYTLLNDYFKCRLSVDDTQAIVMIITRWIYSFLYLLVFNLIIRKAFKTKIFNLITLLSTGLVYAGFLLISLIRIISADTYNQHKAFFSLFKSFVDVALTPPSFEFILIIIFTYLSNSMVINNHTPKTDK